MESERNDVPLIAREDAGNPFYVLDNKPSIESRTIQRLCGNAVRRQLRNQELAKLQREWHEEKKVRT